MLCTLINTGDYRYLLQVHDLAKNDLRDSHPLRQIPSLLLLVRILLERLTLPIIPQLQRPHWLSLPPRFLSDLSEFLSALSG